MKRTRQVTVVYLNLLQEYRGIKFKVQAWRNRYSKFYTLSRGIKNKQIIFKSDNKVMYFNAQDVFNGLEYLKF